MLWVDLFVPRHHRIHVLVVLLKAYKVLHNYNSTAVVEPVSGHVLVSLHSGSHAGTVLFDLVLAYSVAEQAHAENKFKPEVTVFAVIVVFVIVHWVARLCAQEVCLVRPHKVLELNCVFLRYAIRVGVVEVYPVVNLGGVEGTWLAKRVASKCSTVCSGYASVVVTQVVHVILCSFFL